MPFFCARADENATSSDKKEEVGTTLAKPLYHPTFRGLRQEFI
jgi:hypothetical protein